ncbi:MAG: HIT domain-containing protein [Alphaproteobacteria bacterium]|nr:HIT domain-containing protein [Alphaproteobacteria bacterium]
MFEASYDDNNVFAKILRGQLPCDKLAENDHAIAFKDLHPKARFHALVIPRGEYVNIHHFIRKATADEQVGFWNLVADIAELARSDGFNTLTNTGASHGQQVPHFHIHIMAQVKDS